MHPHTVTDSDIPAAVDPNVPASSRPHPVVYITTGAYALLVALTIHFHEPWADEAQAWLLARDAGLAQLWGHLLHYEGTPGLWQTALHVLIRLGLGYSAYNFVSGILGLTAAYLLIRYAPLPLFVRIVLPFTYYLCYQYAVIARSYALVAPLLFAIAVLYRQASRRLAVLTVLLCLLAGVSVHGFLISASLWVTLAWRILFSETRASASERRSFAVATLAYCCVLTFLAVCAWPAQDVAFAEHRGLSNLPLLPQIAKATFAQAFSSDWRISLLLIALSLPLLWRGGGLLFFALASAAFCLFGTIVYAQVWHFGALFLAWLFAIWISAYRIRVTTPALLALIAAVGFQCYWTAAAIRYDWAHVYSGSLEASQYLRKTFGPQGFPPGGLYAVGYPATALQPYFSRNIYSDFDNQANGAYWDWSKRNTADDPAALFASDRREMVLVGYKNLVEKQHWAEVLSWFGYRITKHFDGATFWQTGVLEFESYDLYRQTSALRASNRVNVADPAQAPQLLNGFYDIEGGKSRWTAQTFTVLLKAPPGSDRNGAELALQFYFPDAQAKRSGAMMLSAEVGGRSLPAQTFTRADVYTYSAHVAPETLRSGFVVVNFRLDKSAVGLNGDSRELGVIVTEVSLDPPSQAR